MSFKVDVEQSNKARAEGNAAFKKGKWVEAIGRYTTATVLNPRDPVAYTNRAAAYIKLEKWQDVERDTSMAIECSTGSTPNMKALYRRSIARKALGSLSDAMADIDEVLRTEPGNEAAVEEKTEIAASIKKDEERKAKAAQSRKSLPPSPPRIPTPLPAGEIVPIGTKISTSKDSDRPAPASSGPSSESSMPDAKSSTPQSTSSPPVSASSFAELRKGRQAGKKRTFISPETTSPSAPLADRFPPSVTVPSQTPHHRQRIPSNQRNDDALPNPSPLSPIALLQYLRSHPPLSGYHALAAFSSTPTSLVTLGTLLEPDDLGRILHSLLVGLQEDQNGGIGSDPRTRKIARNVVNALRGSPRWGLGVMMLSSQEREWGNDLWNRCEGEGEWTASSLPS